MEQPVSANNRVQQLEEALRESTAMVAAGQFAVAMMHRINDPLEAISNLNFLVQTSSIDDLQVRYYSGLLAEQLRLLASISRQTRSFYHPRETLETSEIALLAEAALHIHRQKITRKQIRLVKRLPGDVTVEIHPTAMLQVFSSVIENAVEALPVGGILQLRARCRDGHAHILVADNGQGIRDEIRLSIFEFFRTTNEQGQGLGLAIAKAIVERYRGRIRSRTSSRAGKSGTAFRISLPIRANKTAVYVG